MKQNQKSPQEEQQTPLESAEQENAIEQSSEVALQNTEEQAIFEQKPLAEENSIKEENLAEQENVQVSYDEFKASLSAPEKRSLANLEKSELFTKLRRYFSANTPHITQENGVVPICVNAIALRYIGNKEFYIRTRNEGFKINKGDVVILADGAYGRAYARMSVFEKL